MVSAAGRSPVPKPTATLRAARVSRWVRERLGAGGRAVVVGVQRQACHLAIDPAGLLILSAPGVPLAPNAIAVESAPDEVRVGHTVALPASGQGDGEADWLVVLGAGTVWDPRPRVRPIAPRTIEDRLRVARATAVADGGRESLLALLWGSPGDTAATRRACGPARLLSEAATRGDAPSVAAAAAGLAGLGPGLTPSGDDVLAGFAAAWTLVGESLGRDRERREGVTTALLSGARPGASWLGRAWLEHAVRGELPEPMTRFGDALFAADPRDLVPAVRRMLAVGASSGTDWAVGFLLGAAAVLEATPWS